MENPEIWFKLITDAPLVALVGFNIYQLTRFYALLVQVKETLEKLQASVR
jgi:hypothetical protein